MKGARAKRYAAYRREVWRLTDEHHPFRIGTTRQHHVCTARGFAWDIPPELIGSPENVSYMPLSENLAIGTRLDDTARENLKRWGYDGRA